MEQGCCQDTSAHAVHSRRDPRNGWNTNTITAYWMSLSQNQQRWKQGEGRGFQYTLPVYKFHSKTQATASVGKIVTDYPLKISPECHTQGMLGSCVFWGKDFQSS